MFKKFIFLVVFSLNCNILFSINYTQEELNFLKNSPSVTVGAEKAFMPFSFYNERTGSADGLSNDLLILLSKKTGLKFKVVWIDDLANNLERIRNNEVDLLTSLSKTEERSDYLLFSKPYIKVKWVILTNKKLSRQLVLEDLDQFSFGVCNKHFLDEYISQNYPDYSPYKYKNELELLQALSIGNIDAALIDLATASYSISHESLPNIFISGSIEDETFLHFGVAKTNTLLLSILNKGLDEISDIELGKIREKWMSLEDFSFFRKKTFWVFVLSFIMVFSGFFVVFYLWNVSLKRAVEEKTANLLEAERLMREMIDHMPSYIFVLDSSFKIKIVNKSVMRLVTGSEEIISSYFFELCPFLSFCKDGLLLAIDHGKTTQKERVSFFYKNKQIFADILIFPISQDYAVVRIDDKSEAERLYQQLVKVQQLEAVSSLSGGLVHDFNNILASIKGSVDLIELTEAATNKNVLDYIKIIEKATNRGISIVKDLSVAAEKYTYNFSSIDIIEILTDVLNAINVRFGESVRIKTIYTESHCLLNLDTDKIYQALLNICINACHAMTLMRGRGSGRGLLKVVLKRVSVDELFGRSLIPQEIKDLDCGFCMISIIDNGVGIPKEMVNKIFDPLYTTKKEGSGLGLSMVLNIIKGHSGYIEIDSHVNQGTTFNLFLKI
ncbi:MAG: transporter substrate-binding domain-containing protein [Spirochaetales bacterium]|nr:transporter substrate-binding domain-containing protein [Spirochaetales bacterium]